ncbi:DMT family transporter [Corynebacterium uterequi]|uniref:Cation/cationic drug transporter n=1 Tax=Corynebacterium uterequi TaxID=1072256 RepID=A0A0G3HG75_9CORY|nr:SMR family transporter [Corynebacterium uterequi]AKK10107.1 cation/cationic drug transporter [Corynebacterium uterequi]
MDWLLLALAIASEVTGTMSLRVAAGGRRRLYAVVAVAYVASYAFLSGALALGMPLGMAYGVWTSVGVVLTALLGKVFFGEALTWVMGLGIVCVIAGVMLVDLGVSNHG